MLSELRIRNFALIDQLTLRLEGGLNVLTGETGAGKSIVVGALALLLGERASSELVREGAEKATVEGLFEIEGRPELRARLEESGVEAGEGVVILKREVAAEGRSRAWINASPTTVALLAEVGSELVSLHGQHQHQTLLKREEQRAILDAFGSYAEVTSGVARAHEALATISRDLATLEQRRREALQRADFLRFQLSEINGAAPEVGEEERLEEESRRLSHAEELVTLAGSLSESIAGGSNSIGDRLGGLRRALDQLVRIDPSQHELSELFDTAYYALEELGTRLDAYLPLVEHDPARLESIRQRQDLLYRLRAKYGPTLADVIQTAEDARRELGLVDDAEANLAELVGRRDDVTRELSDRAAELSVLREAAAADLQTEVGRILPELGMEGGRFQVVRLPLAEIGAHGAEEIEFRVSLNRGFEPRPLALVASGGELSRVMLALKTILARLDEVPTLIFDEVDAGIGGRVALHVGDKMREVARGHQVLAITHLPQIASRAHLHLLVRKDDEGTRTTTSVATLDEAGRSHEIARMLGGDPESDVSLTHARELLEKGRAVDAPAPAGG
jgi:DNA repair protein RecN (Recombination protein N)